MFEFEDLSSQWWYAIPTQLFTMIDRLPDSFCCHLFRLLARKSKSYLKCNLRFIPNTFFFS